MKKITVYIVMALLCLNFWANAQIKPPTGGLNIGDTVPDIIISNIINYPTKTAKISDFKGKLLILDFWATWCTACIQNFPNIEKLQERFNDKVRILAVAYEPAAKINSFFKSKAGQQFHFPTVTGDTILVKLFPHRLVPHYVWIGVDGKVKAFTAGEQLSEENFTKMLEGERSALQVKKDISTTRPLFLSDAYPSDNELMHYSLLSKGRYDGLAMGAKFRRTGTIIRGRALTNATILQLYEATMIPLFEQKGNEYDKKRLALEITDLSHVTLAKEKTEYYNYEFIVPVRDADSLYQFMLRDLNRYTGYSGRIERRKTSCYVLARIDTSAKIFTEGGQSKNTLFDHTPAKLINSPISYLVTRLNELSFIDIPIINGTSFTTNIDIQFSTKPQSIKDINDVLKFYGLALQPTDIELDTFVLSEKLRPPVNSQKP